MGFLQLQLLWITICIPSWARHAYSNKVLWSEYPSVDGAHQAHLEHTWFSFTEKDISSGLPLWELFQEYISKSKCWQRHPVPWGGKTLHIVSQDLDQTEQLVSSNVLECMCVYSFIWHFSNTDFLKRGNWHLRSCKLKIQSFSFNLH